MASSVVNCGEVATRYFSGDVLSSPSITTIVRVAELTTISGIILVMRSSSDEYTRTTSESPSDLLIL